MAKTHVIASDLGSGSCKTVVMDLQGRVTAAAQQAYATHYPHPGWVEQDPQDWYAAFCATVRSALKQAAIDPDQVAGVGIAAVTHNVVFLDEQDRPLCPSILIFDDRSAPQVRGILDRWGDEVWERTWNEVSTVWTWPQMLWVRENRPEVWNATRRILFQKDYVRHRLAPSPLTDVIDAGGTLLFDPVREEWIDAFCEDLEVDSAWLPEAVDSLDIVAEVGPQGAADTGLAVGTPVITGTTDTVAEMLGSGGVRTGSAIVKLASVGRIAVVTAEPVPGRHILNYRHVLDGLWYPGTASKSAASSYRWLRDAIWADSDREDGFERMGESAAQAPPGCEGLVFHPHLLGEWAPYWDEQMRASYIGLTARHTRAHLTRAVLEGVAFSLKDALDEMEALGLNAHDIRLIGQGAKSPLWAAIVANVLDRSLRIPKEPDAAYGIALMTAMGVGAVERTPEAVNEVIAMRDIVEPDAATCRSYATLFDIYRDADAALRSIDARLHAFERQHAHLAATGP